MQRFDRERHGPSPKYYCLKIFTVDRFSLQHNNTAEPVEGRGGEEGGGGATAPPLDLLLDPSPLFLSSVNGHCPKT